tara:strand:+ start:2275 stop:3588 length:1314 start_codon:yes stop_codon:yes gene_type:complete
MQIKKRTRRLLIVGGVSTLSMLLMGCVTDQRMLYSQTADNKSVPYLQPSLYRTFENHSNKHVRRLSPQLKVGGPRNFVLNANRLALLLFQLQDYGLAKGLLTQTASIVDTYYAEDRWADKARQIFTAEEIKDYKGDAYERSMLHYYSALTYLALGDSANARAHLKNAFMQDSFAENERYRSDFYLMPLLEAWLLKCEGRQDEADVLLARLSNNQDTSALFSQLGPQRGKKNLVLIEAGEPPMKIASSQYLNVLKYSKRPNDKIIFRGQASKEKTLRLVGDILFQASTRGGRLVDAIIGEKVKFSEDAVTLRNTALGASAVSLGVSSHLLADGNNDAAAAAALVGVGFAVVSGLAEIAARSAATKADTRYWDNLPGSIYFLMPDKLEPTYSFKINSEVYQKKTTILFSNEACKIAWVNLKDRYRIPTIPPNAYVFSND